MNIRTFTLMTVSGLLTLASLCFSMSPTAMQVPPGKWTWSYSPISMRGLTDGPVRILDLTGSRKNGGTVARVSLHNRTDKTVVAISFAWAIFRKDSPEIVLAEGVTSVIGLGELPAGAKRLVDYPIVSLSKHYQALMKNGEMNGDFVTEIVVKELLFDDDTKWQRK